MRANHERQTNEFQQREPGNTGFVLELFLGLAVYLDGGYLLGELPERRSRPAARQGRFH